MFLEAHQILETIELYMELNGFCILVVLVRVLRLLDFQPRLGLVTKTIAAALTDLIHFFFLLGLIMGLYWFMAYFLFGSGNDGFSEPLTALNSVWDMMLGGTDNFEVISGQYKIIGVVYMYSFNLIVFFVLLNILLAILVEAYMDVRGGDVKDSKPAYTEIYHIAKSVMKDFSCVRSFSKGWLKDYYASDAAIVAGMGPEPEEDPFLDKTRESLKVPVHDGKWLNAGIAGILKALNTHPDTKGLDALTMARIACTMVYRFGDVEEGSMEGTISMDFSDTELQNMAGEIKKAQGLKEEIPQEAQKSAEEAILLPSRLPSIVQDSIEEAHVTIQQGEQQTGTAWPDLSHVFGDAVPAADLSRGCWAESADAKVAP